jgi:hypothetical protein
MWGSILPCNDWVYTEPMDTSGLESIQPSRPIPWVYAEPMDTSGLESIQPRN